MPRRAKEKKKVIPRPKIGKKVVKSDFEYEVYKALKGLIPRGATVDYETEKLEYAIPSLYIPDFIVTLKDDSKIYIESKGYFPYSERAKMLAVVAANPSIDIRLLFMRDSPSSLGKGSKSRPSDWATKNGFKFAIGEIPKEWFEND